MVASLHLRYLPKGPTWSRTVHLSPSARPSKASARPVLVVDTAPPGLCHCRDILLTPSRCGARRLRHDGTLGIHPSFAPWIAVYWVESTAMAASTRTSPTWHQRADSCGNVRVVPGDIILGDEEGWWYPPQVFATQIADESWEATAGAFIRETVEAGASTFDVYSPTRTTGVPGELKAPGKEARLCRWRARAEPRPPGARCFQ